MAGEDTHGGDGQGIGEATPCLVSPEGEPGDRPATDNQGPIRLEQLRRRLPLGSGPSIPARGGVDSMGRDAEQSCEGAPLDPAQYGVLGDGGGFNASLTGNGLSVCQQ